MTITPCEKLLHRTPLHAAINADNKEMVTLLLDKGADVNLDPDVDRPLVYGTRDSDNAKVLILTRRPLYAAIQKGNREMVALLLDRGARLDVQDKEGTTPLQYALRLKKEEVSNLFRQRGAKE